MKIDSSLKPSGAVPGSSRARAEQAGTSTGAGTTQVQLSAASAQLAGSGSGAPIDGARIAEIKQAIAEGRFQINADAIADGLLSTARDLVQSQRKA